MVVPYAKGLRESLKMYAENMVYKHILKEAIPSKASRWLPKDKDPIIYRYKCDRVECDDECIGES